MICHDSLSIKPLVKLSLFGGLIAIACASGALAKSKPDAIVKTKYIDASVTLDSASGPVRRWPVRR